MSRSYKKHAVCKDSDTGHAHRYKGKTIANRITRRSDVPSGRAGYKKVYCSWNISDWRFYGSEYALRKAWDNGDEDLRKKYKSYEQALWMWKKVYRRK